VSAVRVLLLAISWLMFVLTSGCAGSGVSRTFGFTPAGKFDVSQCAGACVEKLTVADGGERCIKFTRAMADVCFGERDKVVPRGTLVLAKDP
jgi:hypothetical protein